MKAKTRGKRLLSILLACIMLLGIMPTVAHAEDRWVRCLECDSYYTDDEDTCVSCGRCCECWQETHCQYCGECHGEDGPEKKCDYCERCDRCSNMEFAEAVGLDLDICNECIWDSRNFSVCLHCHELFDNMAENDYCVECCLCQNCWDNSNHCIFCGCEGDICDECVHAGYGTCISCHADEGYLCSEDDSHCILMEGNRHTGTDHCLECCIECPDCGKCIIGENNSCEECDRCENCKVEYECTQCDECTAFKEACIDGTTEFGEVWCLDCCVDGNYHCESCELHVLDWCETGGEAAHCIDCANELTCDECGECTECSGSELCDTCGYCLDCCEQASADEGCECGLCVQDPDFPDHYSCASCENPLCGANPHCEFCHLCEECCEKDNQCKHDFCLDDEENMKAHTCIICKDCFAENELCESCETNGGMVICENCCAEQSGCGHDVCINDDDAWLKHWCFEYNDCFENCDHDYVEGSTSNHAITPTDVLSYNGMRHWNKCKYCDDIAHGTNIESHTYVKGKCKVCGCGKDEGKAPTIVVQPKTQSVVAPLAGETTEKVTFTVKASETGTSLITYQWQKLVAEATEFTEAEWEDIEEATSASYSMGPYGSDDRLCQKDGMTVATLRCKLTNEFGTTLTREVKLRVKHNDGRYDIDNNALPGMHWKACASCLSGKFMGTAEPHDFEHAYGCVYEKTENDIDYYRMTCRICEYSELREEGRPYFAVQPMSQSAVCPYYGADEDGNWEVAYTTFEVEAHEVGNKNGSLTYQWQVQEPGKTQWKNLEDYESEVAAWVKGSTTPTLTIGITGEACSEVKESKGLYGTYRCVVYGSTGLRRESNEAKLRINHNSTGWGYLPQRDNVAWENVSNGKDLYNKHWPVCGGRGKTDDDPCGKNPIYRLAEEHDMGPWEEVGTSDYWRSTCNVCGYYEQYHYRNDIRIGHFDEVVRFENMSLDAEVEIDFKIEYFPKSDDRTLRTQWVKSQTGIVSMEDGEVFTGWDTDSPVENDTLLGDSDSAWIFHTIKLTKGSCKKSQEVKDSYKYFCMLNLEKAPDPTKPKDSLSTRIIKVIIEHNHEITEFDDTYHWKKCDICEEYIHEDSKVLHTYGEWKKADKGGYERKCTDPDCGATQTTNVAPAKSAAYCTVSFAAGTGSGTMESVPVKKGDYYRLPACTFTAPEGQKFQAWQVNGEVVTRIKVDADVTVTALWVDSSVTPPSCTHQLSGWKSDANGHWKECTISGCTHKEQEANHEGGTATCQAKAECATCNAAYGEIGEHDYDISTWGYKSADGHAHCCKTAGCTEHDTITAHIPGAAATETEPQTCTACGYVMANATGYTITFDANGGVVNTQTAQTDEHGKLATLPTPTRSGRYDFDGWFDAPRGGNKITPDTIFTENTIVYAHWTYTGGGFGGGGGTVLPIYHTIKATAGVGGSISPDGTKSLPNGGSQTYIITPDSGYEISDVKVDGRSVGAVKTYTFRNVKENHTILASFEKVKTNPNTGAFPFVDVSTDDWFFGDVAYVYDHDLMNGTSDTTFAPNLTTSRAMIVTILYRLEGEPVVYGTSSFSDVESSTWYSKAVVWAEQNGIVKGYDNGKFGVNDDITREQLAAILYRYMQFKGMNAVTMSENLTSFSDHEQVSGYAVQAVNWAVANGLINGADNKLMPTDGATRAQVAAILHRFCENVLK